VQALLVAVAHPQGISADEGEALDPLLRTADYYGWFAAVSFVGGVDGAPPDLAADLLLVTTPTVGSSDGVPVGGGLDGAFWHGEDEPAGCAVRYGVIPDDVTPEAVIERLGRLRHVA
jgi:hypothetical protein